MSKAMKLMLVLAICMFTLAAFAQTSQDPTIGQGTVKGVDKFGALPSGSKTAVGAATGNVTGTYAINPGQQFNSKWAMVGGIHDLTTNATKTGTWNGGTVGQSSICAFCHTAHDNESEYANRDQLWAHEVPTTFEAYTSATLQSSPNTAETSQTAQCMGCHDGTIAVTSGAYGTPGSPAAGVPGATADYSIGGVAITVAGKLTGALMVPLSRTHPVSFTYDATLASKHQLRVPASAKSIDGFGIVPLFGSTGTMECATCHDPHIKSGIMRRQFPTGATQDNGTGSFCLYCHL